MRLRLLAATSLVAVAAAGTLAPALAAPAKPKPFTKTYEVGPLTPDPTPIAGDICDPATPTAIHSEAFKIPGAGRVKVDIDFVGDWALAMRDAKKGSRLAESDGGTPETDESMDVKFKKAGEIFVDSCNFAGAPTATVTVSYTPK